MAYQEEVVRGSPEVVALARREPGVVRPYRVIGYPVTPILFCICCVFMLYSSIDYAISTKPVALYVAGGILLTGAVIYVFTRKWDKGEKP